MSPLLPATTCRYFEGYKPCCYQKSIKKASQTSPHIPPTLLSCSPDCQYFSEVLGIILVVDIGGIGTLIRLTPLLRKLKKDGYLIYFLGAEKSGQLFDEEFPLIKLDGFFTNNTESIEYLGSLHFSMIINYESGKFQITSWVSSLDCDSYHGFKVDKLTGSITLDTTRKGELQMLQCQVDDEFRRQLNLPFQQILLEMAGFRQLISEDIRMEVTLYEQLHTQARDYIEILFANRDSKRKLIGLNIGCAYAHRAKRWDAANFYFLAQSLPGYDFLALWGPDDEDALKIMQALQESTPLPNLFIAEPISLSLFAHVIYQCDALVSAETMASNLAIALPTWEGKIVVLTGPQPDWEVWFQDKEGVLLSKRPACMPCYRGTPSDCLWAGSSDERLCMKVSPLDVKGQLTNLLEP